MKKLTLFERVEFVIKSVEKGYLIGQWHTPQGIWMASHENNAIGFYLHEIMELQ